MKVSPAGLNFIKSFESFVPYVYDDKRRPVGGRYREWSGEPVVGTLTIGYGHTNAAKHPLKIRRGLRITEAEARQILDVDLDECEEDVNRMVRVPIDQSEFDALVSFTFNCGPRNLARLIAPLNRGDYAGTRNRFDAYVRSKGTYMRGLQRRRDAEQAMWDRREVRLPTGVEHHSAEVDGAEGTVGKNEAKEIVKQSRRLTWSERMAKFLEFCGVGSATFMAFLQQSLAFLTDWRTLAVFAVGGLFYVFVRLNLWHSIKEAAEGRYKPSGAFSIPAADGDSDGVFTPYNPPAEAEPAGTGGGAA